MKLTAEQKAAINHAGNVSLIACPGSGKTRALIAKTAKCHEDVVGTSRKIACITYTNSAANEVCRRLGRIGIKDIEDDCEISTIHSFCLNNILKHFHWMVDQYSDGFTVLPPDSDYYREVAGNLIREYDLDRRYAPGQFELLNREADGTPIANWPLTPEIALNFWQTIEQEGYIDFPNILYWSCKLIQNNVFISNALASKYAWILIDEFQDTTSLQVQIFSTIFDHDCTNYFVVGDPYQSIYRFAGARSDLFECFENKIHSTRKYLTGNWRSSQNIIADAESLSPRPNAMIAVGKYKDYFYEAEWHKCGTAFEGITDFFLPALKEHSIRYGDAAIFAPWWIPLLHLGRKLRDYGIPISGPGSRPYKRSHLIAPLVEEIGALIREEHIYQINSIERELFLLLNNLDESRAISIYSYFGRKIIYELINTGSHAYDRCNGSGKAWILEMGNIISDVLIQNELTTKQTCEKELLESSQRILEDMMSHGVDIENLSVEDIGLYARNNDSVHLLTMHKAKGLEYEAVALIDLHDGRLPHFKASTNDDIEDSRRLFYVAITRAQKILMYFTDQEDRRNGPTPFLEDLGFNFAN